MLIRRAYDRVVSGTVRLFGSVSLLGAVRLFGATRRYYPKIYPIKIKKGKLSQGIKIGFGLFGTGRVFGIVRLLRTVRLSAP